MKEGQAAQDKQQPLELPNVPTTVPVLPVHEQGKLMTLLSRELSDDLYPEPGRDEDRVPVAA